MTTSAHPDAIVVIDFGSQYTHLIARRIRELRVYSEIIPATAGPAAVSHLNARGIILSGGPASVYDAGAPAIPGWVLESDVPTLGICYGMQADGASARRQSRPRRCPRVRPRRPAERR